jgi:hypothetical protein
MRETHGGKPFLAVGERGFGQYDVPMKTKRKLDRILTLTAASVLLATLAVWVGTGSHLGWTRTSAVLMQHDEITGIDYPVHQLTFVAGVEVLALGSAAAVALAASGWTARRFSSVRV